MDGAVRVKRETAAKETDQDLGRELTRLAEKLLHVAKELDGASPRPPVSAEVRDMIDDAVLAAIARTIFRARERRQRQFSPRFLGEPGWDMLLELFIHRALEMPLSTKSLCLAAGVPRSTALRMMRQLEEEGLLQRSRSAEDKRIATVEMTPHGFSQMRIYVTDGITRSEMPLPEPAGSA